jgi:hypothetical protein
VETKKLETLNDLRNNVRQALGLKLLGASLSMDSSVILPAHHGRNASASTLVSSTDTGPNEPNPYLESDDEEADFVSPIERPPKMFALQRRPTDLARMALEMEPSRPTLAALASPLV